MKLNTRRTLLVGLAFMTISAFWQVYNNVIPLIMKTTFELNDTIAGIVMGLDNVLALFMLPLFGMLSDKTDTRIGKRMPYILFGTLAAVASMILLHVFNTPTTLIPFAIALGIILIAMSTYRSPAVALMPDVTIKPLLSKGNAIINLMGTVGGILALAMIAFLVPKGDNPSYLVLFIALGAMMLIGVIVLLFFGDENRFRAEKEQLAKELHISDEEDENESTDKLDKAKLTSLFLILASIFLWFFGYNAIVSAYSKYALVEWGLDGGLYAYALMVAQGTALIAFIPIGILATRIGRKKTILIGIGILTAAFATAGLFREFNMLILILFAFAGIGWATINVNSFPMVVSLSRGSDIGKYTGYYYTASMASQILTPIVSGALLEYVGYWTLFPYGALFVALSAITMVMVKHGDSKPLAQKSKLEAFDVDD